MLPTSGLSLDQAPPLDVPLRFFATMPLFMAAAGLSLMWAGSDLFTAALLPGTVALAHMAVLGWVSMAMFGAMYQMIPVLGSVAVPWQRLSPWVHGFFVMGVASIGLGIGMDLHRWFLLSASLGLGVAVVLFLVQIATALIKTTVKHPTVNAMRLSALSLCGTFLLGAVFLGEYAHGFLDYDRQAMVGTHLTWGLIGWAGILLVGVSYQVLPMFYMMPQYPEKQAAWTLWGMVLSLLAVPVALFTALENPWILLLAGLPAMMGILLYARTMGKIMADRKRKVMDTTMRFWLLGLGSGAISLLLLVAWPFVEGETLRFLFAVLYIVGFLSSTILGMIYKVVPFLVWFHRFSRLVGLATVPMMDDLVQQRASQTHFLLHALLNILLVLSVLTLWDPLLRLSGLLLLANGGYILYALWFALKEKPPEMPAMPDFASFFKDMPPPDEMP